MRYLISILFLFISWSSYTQEKHKGLLWEISGNGLKKKSYLYGTMHVSGKIAYYLGEEFFQALESVDAVALESNPIIWLDEILNSKYAYSYLGRYGIKNQTYKGFYKSAFKLSIPDSKTYGRELALDHYLSNWMLYRGSSAKTNFEEETFLDMFIYQAGSKKDKPVYSLEDFKQTSIFSLLSQVPDIEKKEPSAWYKKLTKEKKYYDILEDAYRDQDLDLLDSLQKEVSSENHMNYMLYLRNEIMANNIDSIIANGTSLFVGIGAAHLPKAKGVIGLLKSKGYKLNPILPTITASAKIKKETLSKLKKAKVYNNTFSSELFTTKAPCKIYETPTNSYKRSFFGPELTNGTFYTIKQISTYSYLKGKESNSSLSLIDSLLFENIPGKIIKKTAITNNGFSGIDILNKTKTGDVQRYQIFQTPLNIFIFKIGGKNDFVTYDSDQFYKNIELKPLSKEWTTITPLKNDFTIDVPNYYHIKNNTKIGSLYDQLELEAYDSISDSYYIVKRTSLHDFGYIEEDAFELKRLINKFCDNLKIDSVENISINTKATYPKARGIAKTASGKNLTIEIHIKGAYYYITACVGKPNKRFFDSFTLNDFKYTFKFEPKADSILNFTVNSNYLSPNKYYQMIDIAYSKRKEKKNSSDTEYLRKSKKEFYYSENFEKIKVEYVRFHRYKEYKHVDSIWNKLIRSFEKDKSVKLTKKKVNNKVSMPYAELYFSDTNSTRIIYQKYILNKGTLYGLNSLIDSSYKLSEFITSFYATFKPNKNNSLSVLPHKPDLFFDAINGTDSLEKVRALKSVEDYIVFKDEDTDKMIKAIESYSFGAKHITAKAQLIKDLGKLNNEKTLPFLNTLYTTLEDTAIYQLAVLKSLAQLQTKKSTNQFISLLEKDIPLSGNKWGNMNIFRPFYDSLPLTNHLFPKLLNYTFVPSYKKDIYNLLAAAVKKNKIKPKRYKRKYKQILNEAKLELKTQISYEQSEQAKEADRRYYYNSYKNEGNLKLVKYATILLPLYKKADVQSFFNKLNNKVQDYSIKTDIACAMITNKISVPSSTWEFLAKDRINQSYLYEKLEKINRLDLFPSIQKTQKNITSSLLYNSDFNFNSDSLLFIEKRLVNTKKGTGYVYFYKSKTGDNDKWKLDYIGLQPENLNLINTNDVFNKKGEKISNDKPIKELIDEKVKEIEITGYKRANEKDNESFNLFDY